MRLDVQTKVAGAQLAEGGYAVAVSGGVAAAVNPSRGERVQSTPPRSKGTASGLKPTGLSKVIDIDSCLVMVLLMVAVILFSEISGGIV